MITEGLKMRIEDFAEESNWIERDNLTTPAQHDCVQEAYEMGQGGEPLTLKKILEWHSRWFPNAEWRGRWRDCQVYVGNHTPPIATKVPELMEQFIKDLPNMDAWTAHNEMARIHGLQDGNGRMSRLVWLYKASQRGFRFQIPFLQMYYYSTLQKYDDKEIG